MATKKSTKTQHTSQKKENQQQAKSSDEKQQDIDELGFGKVNYALFILAIIIICIGYLLLYGGGSDNPAEFSPEIFSTRRITIAPLTLLAGFAIVFFAIMYRPKKPAKQDK